MKFLPVAKLTFFQNVKERFFLGMLFIELLLLLLSYYFSQVAPGDSVKVAMDFALSFLSVLVALFVALVTVNSLYRDLSEKFVYLVLSKPVTRDQYLIGKFLGSLATVAFFLFCSFILTGVAFLAYSYFINLYTPHPILLERLFLFFLLLFLSSTLLTAVSVLSALLFSNQILAAVVTLLTWFIGLELGPVKELVVASKYATPFSKLVVTVAYYFFPNFSLYSLKGFVVYPHLSFSLAYLGLAAVYALVYTVALMLISSFLFNRREL